VVTGDDGSRSSGIAAGSIGVMISVQSEGSRTGLRPANEAGSLSTYLHGLWARRDYVWYVAVNDLRSQQMNTVLGNLWHLLNPLLQIGVYYLIFGVIVGTDRGVDNMIGFLAVGVFTYQFSQRSTLAGARSIVTNLGLMRSISFPRALLPITSTMTQLFHAIPGIAVMLFVVLITGEQIRLAFLAVPFLFAVQFAFNVGAAFVAARATTQLRDIEQILPFVFRILFYMSGVIFNVESYIDENGWRWLFNLNPLYGFVSLMRWAVMDYPVDWGVLVSVPLWTIGLFTIGFWWFHRAEEAYGRD
jgi:teichoic acid transport system permease protein